MDGHEWDDIVKYRNDVFLPSMACFEKWMAHYEGPEMKQVDPILAEVEKQIIVQFHDECCFHANDETKNLW